MNIYSAKSQEINQNIPFQKALNLVLSVYTRIFMRLIDDLLFLEFRLPPRCKYNCPFRDFTQRRLVVSYRRFGTTYLSHLQRSSSPVFLDCHSMAGKIAKNGDLAFFVIFEVPMAIKF